MLADIGCLLVCYCQLISDDYCWQNNTYVCCLQHTTVRLCVTWCRMLADMCCLLWHLLSAEDCWQNDACPGLLLSCILLLVCTISFCCLLIAADETDPYLVTSFSCFHGFYLILFVICCLIPALPFLWLPSNNGRRFLSSLDLLPVAWCKLRHAFLLAVSCWMLPTAWNCWFLI